MWTDLYLVLPLQPLSPKAEEEMRRAKAALCIDEEVDLQSILEEMAEKNKEMEKSEDGSKDNEDEDDDNDKEMDKDRFSESVGSAQGSLSQTPTSFTPTLGPKVDHRKEIFLTPATSVCDFFVSVCEMVLCHFELPLHKV